MSASLLRRGSRGDAVIQLQQQLIARGYQLEADGVFGRRTEAAVRHFQEAAGAKVDGVVGQQTRDAFEQVATPRRRATDGAAAVDQLEAPRAPANATERQRYEYYANMVRAAGGQVNPGGQPTVLGLRTGSGQTSGQYNDRFVVLTADGRVREFQGSTDPAQARSSLSRDANGTRGVGMMAPGNYDVRPNGDYQGRGPSFHVRTLGGSGSLPGWRDTNGDGVHSAEERQASRRRGDKVTEILFHAGRTDAPQSIGCLTMHPDVHRRFVEAVGGAGASFNFTLVDGQ